MSTFLETMFANLDDISEGSDADVKQELEEMGVDVEKTRKSLVATIDGFGGGWKKMALNLPQNIYCWEGHEIERHQWRWVDRGWEATCHCGEKTRVSRVSK